MTEPEIKPVEKPEAEVKTEVKPEVKDEVQTETKPDHEASARESGWTPKEEFKGDPEKWVDAKEWIDRAPLFDEMKRLRKKTKSLEGTINQLKGHYDKVEANAYQRAVDNLKEAKLTALEEGDHKAVLQIDDKIDELKEQKRTSNRAPAVDNNAFETWRDKNDWYDNDTKMRAHADEVGVRFAIDNPDRSPQEAYAYAEERVRSRFPEKFANSRREAPPPVEGVRSSPVKSGKPRWSDMPEAYQRAGDKFVRQGIMTREQYMADLVKIGELK